MADHPLRSATHRRLGGPLPHQLANGTRAHLCPSRLLPLPDAGPWSYAVLAPISKCYPPDRGRLLTRYSPVRHYAYFYAPFDLHVLSTPPAFVLSQNQTLMLFFRFVLFVFLRPQRRLLRHKRSFSSRVVALLRLGRTKLFSARKIRLCIPQLHASDESFWTGFSPALFFSSLRNRSILFSHSKLR